MMTSEPPHEVAGDPARFGTRWTTLLVMPMGGVAYLIIERGPGIAAAITIFHTYLLIYLLFLICASSLITRLARRTELGRRSSRDARGVLALAGLLLGAFWLPLSYGRADSAAVALSGVVWVLFLSYFAAIERALWRELNPAVPMPWRAKWWRWRR
jgi:hypothetical protein